MMKVVALLALLPALAFHGVVAADALGLPMPLAMTRMALWLDRWYAGELLLAGLPALALLIAWRRRARALIAALLVAELLVWGGAFELADAAYQRTRRERLHAALAAPSDVGIADPAYAEAIERGRRWARRFMADFSIPGLQVAVSAGGRVVWAEAFGFASIEERRALRIAMPMRIHSVSKPITATLAAMLAERGRLDLDAPVSRYVPSYRFGSAMTPRQLAMHTAGVRHYGDDAEVLNRRPFTTSAERIAQFANDPLLFRPGTRFRYSSFGYVLLGGVIERAAGSDYLTALQTFVAAPADMTSIAADSRHNAVRYYERTKDGRLVLVPPLDPSNRLEAGGLAASATDVARFADAFVRGRLVSERTKSTMLTRGLDPKYGFGWELARDFASHQGGSTGGMSMLILDPEDRTSMAIIGNSNGELPPRTFPLPPHVVLRYFDVSPR